MCCCRMYYELMLLAPTEMVVCMHLAQLGAPVSASSIHVHAHVDYTYMYMRGALRGRFCIFQRHMTPTHVLLQGADSMIACWHVCPRYAGLLEASMDHTPNVCSIPPGELITFCMDQAYACRLEPLGTLLIPPDFNVGVTDWERSIR